VYLLLLLLLPHHPLLLLLRPRQHVPPAAAPQLAAHHCCGRVHLLHLLVPSLPLLLLLLLLLPALSPVDIHWESAARLLLLLLLMVWRAVLAAAVLASGVVQEARLQESAPCQHAPARNQGSLPCQQQQVTCAGEGVPASAIADSFSTEAATEGAGQSVCADAGSSKSPAWLPLCEARLKLGALIAAEMRQAVKQETGFRYDLVDSWLHEASSRRHQQPGCPLLNSIIPPSR